MKILSPGGIRGRMALLVLVSVMLVSALMFAASLKERKLIRSHMEEDLLHLVGLVALDQDEFISQTRQLLLALSRLPELKEPVGESCPELLSKLVAEFPRYREIGVVDRTGVVVCGATGMGGMLNFSGEPWYTRAVISRDFSLGAFHSALSDETALTVGYPLVNETGEATSVIFATVDLAHFTQFVSHVRPVRAVEFVLVTRGGAIVNRYPGAGARVVDMRGRELLAQAMFRKGVGTVEVTGGDGLTRLYGFAPLCASVDTGLFVAVGIPVSTLFSAGNKIVALQFGGLWLVSLAAISIIWFGSERFIIKPLDVVARTARRLAAGEAAARTLLPRGNDEIGSLARSFDDMAEALELRDGELRGQKDRLRSFASQLSVAEERERRRIATDLHDRVGQLLALSRMKLGMLGQTQPNREAETLVREISGFLGDAIRETRTLVFDLSPPILYELGLEAALGYLVEQTRLRHGIVVSHADDGKPKPLAEDVKVFVFRAAGELLLNVVKHSGARRARVTTRRESEILLLCVEDDGNGFEPGSSGARSEGPSGFGLFSIRERLDSLGGRIDVDSAPGAGTRVKLTVPLESDVGDTEPPTPGDP